MTTKDLYKKHKAGEISNQKFLYEVRRDALLPWITNMTSYEDAVQILKNKGIINEADSKKYGDVEVISKTIDMVNPYEYSKGMNYELDMVDNPVRQDLTEEEVLAAQAKVLKNITKDSNYYTKLFAGVKPDEVEGYREIEITGKKLDTNLKAEMKDRKADGYIKKELKKNAKANVKDDLGKKEAGTKKPKGVSEFKAKGVTGSIKVVKEGIEEIIREKLAQKKANEAKVEEHHNDPNFPGGSKIHAMLDKVAEDWGKDSDLYSDLEDAIVGWSDRYGELTPKGVLAVKALLSNWDSLEDYQEFLPEAKQEESAVQKMKEALKSALKKEALVVPKATPVDQIKKYQSQGVDVKLDVK